MKERNVKGDICGDILTVREAANLLRVTDNTIRNRIRNPEGCPWGTYINMDDADGNPKQPIFRISKTALMAHYYQLFPETAKELLNV